MTARILYTPFFLFALSTSTWAQSNCIATVQQIDSLINQKICPSFNSRFQSNITVHSECEEEILNYTNDKGFLKDKNRDYILKILSELIRISKSQEIRQKAINASLDRSYGFRLANCFSEAYLWNNGDFDSEAKLHLLRFLKGEYTQEEIDRFVEKFTDTSLEECYLSNYASQLTNEKGLSLKESQDSLSTAAQNRAKAYFAMKQEKRNINIPLIMGWFHWREMIPDLQNILAIENDDATRIALARMGDKKSIKYFLKQKEITLNMALYIGTQETIAKFGENLYSTEERWALSGHNPDCGPIPIAYNTIIELQKNLKDFPKLIDKESPILLPKELDQISPDVLIKARSWMKKNKGKYIIKNPIFGKKH